MTRGKNICKQLKEVRRRIAEENNIPLEIEECTYKGECRGTCPRCEAEVRFLENALADRQSLGKVVRVAGVALALMSGGTASAQVKTQQLTPHISVQTSDTTRVEDSETLLGCISEPDPEFPGGMEALYKFIQDSLRYPKEALEKKIEGKVYVSFVVEKDGTITNPKILRDIGGGCGKEAVRMVMTMPKWLPGKQGGVPVRIVYNLPIRFVLPTDHRPPRQ